MFFVAFIVFLGRDKSVEYCFGSVVEEANDRISWFAISPFPYHTIPILGGSSPETALLTKAKGDKVNNPSTKHQNERRNKSQIFRPIQPPNHRDSRHNETPRSLAALALPTEQDSRQE